MCVYKIDQDGESGIKVLLQLCCKGMRCARELRRQKCLEKGRDSQAFR
jgi:hypothetical protein